MKNLTLRIDEKVLAAARKQAAMQGTTVAKAVREYLRNYAVAHLPESPAAKRARRELVELAEQSIARFRGDWKWNREEIYEERMSRYPSDKKRPGFAEPPPPNEDQKVLDRPMEGMPTLVEMTTDTGAPPVPGHDEWVRRQLQETLVKKKAGKLTYTDFRDFAARFDFNAR